MKTVFKDHKTKIIIAASIIAVLLAGIAVTFALRTKQTDDLVNTFTVKPVKSEIEEEVDSASMKKAPKVKNTGDTECLVRVRVNISPSDAEGSAETNLFTLDYQTGTQEGKWSKSEDGFYYYNGYLKPSNEGADSLTVNPLFTHVNWNKKTKDGNGNQVNDYSNWKDFDIIVYQETIQTRANDAQGNQISAIDSGNKYNAENAKKIWEIYDEGI